MPIPTWKLFAASLFAGAIGWLVFLWWREGYRTGVIRTRGTREERATQPIGYWFTMSGIAFIWLVMAACSIFFLLVAVGIIDE